MPENKRAAKIGATPAALSTHFSNATAPGIEPLSREEIQSGGRGWAILFGAASTPFGPCFFARSPRGFCRVAFLDETGVSAALDTLKTAWPCARFSRDDAQAAQWSAGIFRREPSNRADAPFPVCVRGTAFQIRVWRALAQVPFGALTSYGRLAASFGLPGGARAVGAAAGANAIAWIIPCHRLVREDGGLGGYRWGIERKRAMILWEQQGISMRGLADGRSHPIT